MPILTIAGREEKLLFSTSYTLKEIDLDTGVVKKLTNLGTTVYSIAYDVKERYVYLPGLNGNVIHRIPIPYDPNVDFEIVVSTNRPFYVAFDPGSSHLYWTEYTVSGKIMRCNSDGSNVTIIRNVINPMALALDMQNRWIYYSDSASKALYRMTFEGKANQVVTKLTSQVIGILIDYVEKRIYWMEYQMGDLKSAWYNGSDVNTVVSTNVSTRNREIDIGDDYVYYTSINKVIKVRKSSGHTPAVVHTEPSQIYGISFYKQEGNVLFYLVVLAFAVRWICFSGNYLTGRYTD